MPYVTERCPSLPQTRRSWFAPVRRTNITKPSWGTTLTKLFKHLQVGLFTPHWWIIVLFFELTTHVLLSNVINVLCKHMRGGVDSQVYLVDVILFGLMTKMFRYLEAWNDQKSFIRIQKMAGLAKRDRAAVRPRILRFNNILRYWLHVSSMKSSLSVWHHFHPFAWFAFY